MQGRSEAVQYHGRHIYNLISVSTIMSRRGLTTKRAVRIHSTVICNHQSVYMLCQMHEYTYLVYIHERR